MSAITSNAWGDAIAITNSPSGANRSQVGAQHWKALLFSTPAWAGKINYIQLGLNCFDNSCSYPKTENVGIDLYSVQLGLPATQIYNTPLQSVYMSAAASMYTFPIPDWQLNPNTTYALVLKSDSSGIGWANTSAASNPTGLNGYTYQSFKITADGGGTWTNPSSSVNAVVISVTAVPTLAGFAQLMLAIIVIAMLVWHRRREPA